MLSSTTPKGEIDRTYERLMNPPANGEEGIKLLYVTVSSDAPPKRQALTSCSAGKGKTERKVYALSSRPIKKRPPW